MTMKGTLTTDLDTFFNTDEFAVNATINSETVNGVFDNEYIEDIEVSGTSPVFTCKTSDVNDVSQDDPVTIDGTGYHVVSIEPDGTGITKLVLEEI